MENQYVAYIIVYQTEYCEDGYAIENHWTKSIDEAKTILANSKEAKNWDYASLYGLNVNSKIELIYDDFNVDSTEEDREVY